MIYALIFILLEISANMFDDAYFNIALWQMFFAFVMGFSFGRKPTEMKQSILAVFALYCLYIAVMSTFNMFAPSTVVAVEIAVLCLLLQYEIQKKYDYHTDTRNEQNVCIIFYKPLTFFEYIKSLIGAPISSCGLLLGNDVYRFRYSSSMIEKVDFAHEHREYIIIDTGTPTSVIEPLLPDLMATKARSWQTCFFRLNCLLALKPILSKIGGKWQYRGDLLPSIYIMRRLP